MRFLDDKDHQRLKELAKKDHLPMNWLINQAIKKFLKRVRKHEINRQQKKPLNLTGNRKSKVAIPTKEYKHMTNITHFFQR